MRKQEKEAIRNGTIAAECDRAKVKTGRKRIKICTCADEDFCELHPTDTDCLDPNGPWGAP